MTTNWFSGEGVFSEEELKAFIEDYQKNEHYNYQYTIHLGKGVDARIQQIVNEHGKTMGRLIDRLALTIIGLANRKLSQHSGDCSVYASLHNGRPEDGVCTCGYGLQVMRETGDNKELCSEELKGKLIEVARTR